MYTTKTVPPLVLDVNKDEDQYVVTLTGDRVKELMRSKDEKAAKAYFNEVKKHYEEREA